MTWHDVGRFIFCTDNDDTVVMFATVGPYEDALVYEDDCIRYHGHWGRDPHPRPATKHEIYSWFPTDESGRLELRIEEGYRTEIEAIIRRCSESAQ